MNDDCTTCEGSGEFPIVERDGTIRFTIICPACSGLGKEPVIECAAVVEEAPR